MTQYRPSRFEILPLVVKNLLIISCIFFIAQLTIGAKFDFNLEKYFALHSLYSTWFKPWQFITRIFLSSSFLHLFFNMLGLWMLGSSLENMWGSKRFLYFFLSCTIGGSLFYLGYDFYLNHEAYQMFKQLSISEQNSYINESNFILNASALIGCSSGVFGCFVAFAYLNPEAIFYFYFIFPLKAKWILLISIGLELLFLFVSLPNDRSSHISHLGGALIGFILVYTWYRNNKRKFF